MKFTLSQINKEAYSAPFIFERTVDVSDITSRIDNDIKSIDTVIVKGICSIDEEELLFNLSITGKAILTCARTLVDVPYQLDINTTEVFTTDLTKIDDVNDDVHPIIDDLVDLGPVIKENIILHIPSRVFSDEKAIEEGEGWSYYTEDNKTESDSKKIDPRLEKLQILLDKEDKTK